ncbi:carotenoid biosynthesis protein [Granulicella arctica]|uniref:Putative membrane protein n=1 Tax=Granulicella arctica TaxID=940613 RepID=A0A7Y9PLJ2_9BACT|nr:carotenoid biosynthesis protein [Granulicella arctica]NYF81258.1 putative membrane protein [Granulicella arctica]
MVYLLLWSLLLLYAVARFLQLGVGTVPMLAIVALHVVPAAAFALVHGWITYRLKGILVFMGLCLGVSSAFESISLRTGFPFGHYFFTDLMGPKLFQLPVLLALAYVGMGYVSWVLALLILGYTSTALSGSRTVTAPIIASFIMVAWDLAMDQVWATIRHAWIWRDGGAYFGVPVSNFLGWYLTVVVFYLLFAAFLRDRPAPQPVRVSLHWRLPVLFYGVSAVGNLLLAVPRASYAISDASGKQWMSSDIVGACVLISLFVMMPFAALAWIRLKDG